MHKTAIRIGVNEASIRDSKKEDVTADRRVALMLREMKQYVRFFEKYKFSRIVLSAKASDCLRTIKINRLLSETFDYPIHLGLTHAGLPEDAKIPSAVAIGTLLAEGIGDTVRVSMAGDPVLEIKAAQQILGALGLYKKASVELVVCPTCARSQIDVVNLAEKVSKAVEKINKPIRVAVMGCIVNGPGEAADADIAVCAGKGKGYIYRAGKKISMVTEDKIISALLSELSKIK
jgi:(E)-4-hydroxy-3-methylbut-2-enyl-diphosphate synthase